MRNSVFFYFKKSVAFFDLKARAVAPAVFVATLALYAAYLYILQANDADLLMFLTRNSLPGAQVQAQAADTLPSYPFIAASLVIPILFNIISDVYLAAAIYEAGGVAYTAADCVAAVLRNLGRLVAVSILKSLIISIGLMLFIVPGIILMVVLIFAECAVLDRRTTAARGLAYSHALTNGHKVEIFKIELFCNLIISFFAILVLGFFVSNNEYVFLYISLFVISVCMLIERKLVAYLYADALAALHGGRNGNGGGNGNGGRNENGDGGTDGTDGQDGHGGTDGQGGQGGHAGTDGTDGAGGNDPGSP